MNGNKGVSRLAIVGVLIVIILVAAVAVYWYTVTPPPRPLTLGTTDKITVLDPAKCYDFYTWEVFNNIGEGLLKYKPGTTELEMGIAESYTVSDDGLEYTFTLREGMKFTDGEPLDAAAVKWSVDRVVSLDLDPSWLVSAFVNRTEVVDTLKVKFVLHKAVFYFPLVVTNPPYFPVSSGARLSCR